MFKDVTNVTNQESSWEKLNINEWSQHLTDSKSSWQTNGKEINPLPVKDHDWDKGRIDTTNWVLNSQIVIKFKIIKIKYIFIFKCILFISG